MSEETALEQPHAVLQPSSITTQPGVLNLEVLSLICLSFSGKE